MSSIDSLATEVEAAGQAIARLSDDSRDIGVVLDVIRRVAAHNLLVLNAAIDAARTGWRLMACHRALDRAHRRH